MFEDATFESSGKIRTRSLRWMTATFVLNGSILATLIVIPLVRPEALSPQAFVFLLSAPPPPPSPPPADPLPAAHPAQGSQSGVTFEPAHVWTRNFSAATPEVGPVGPVLSMEEEGRVPGGMDAFVGRPAPAVVHPEAKAPVRLSSTMVAGLLTSKTMPVYPAIAKAAGIEGVVVLAATIAKSGTIENLRIVSGPVLLEQAALDAVKSWRYRPYVLDGMPVEVETSIYVVFKLGR